MWLSFAVCYMNLYTGVVYQKSRIVLNFVG
jgi:hypothetical protein